MMKEEKKMYDLCQQEESFQEEILHSYVNLLEHSVRAVKGEAMMAQ